MRKASRLRYAVLWILLIWALISVLSNAIFAIYIQTTYPKYVHAPFTTRPYSLIINGFLPGYEKSGLIPGDEILALNGEAVRGHQQIDQMRFHQHPGGQLIVTVRRPIGTQESVITIPVQLHQTSTIWTRVLVIAVLIPLFCVVVGFYIVLARPNDRLAWITMAMLIAVGQAVNGNIDWGIRSPWREITFVYTEVLSSSWPFFMVLFALYFPRPFGWLSRCERWLIPLLALPFVVFSATGVYGDFMVGNHAATLAALSEFVRATELPTNVLFAIYVIAFLFLLAWKKQILKENDARRRLNVMIAGCSLALIPLLPVVFMSLPLWLSTACIMMLVFFPLTMAYVIVVQRAMDVRMVVRSGVRYAVASNGLKILRICLITYVAILIVVFERRSETRVEGILVGIIGATAIILVGRVIRSLSTWMDRRFFREAYNAELILTDLSNAVAGMRDSKTLVQTVAQRISESLHVDRIAVLLHRGSIYHPAFALGFDTPVPPVRLTPDAVTVRTLKTLRQPSRVYFDDPQSWVQSTTDAEREALRKLDAHLLLPLTLKNRLLGLISLGAKRSEAPYSRADLQLLSAVASQTGLALENAELTETIRREIAQRERLDRELEIARDVQQRLFPQKLPLISGLDLSGFCRPAEVVGGDYYDFVPLADSCLAIAVGDVSGKGIGAALMMASLQASVRAQARKPSNDLGEVIEHISRLIYEASSENRYATFFYAEYHAPSRCLHYVNAGHNPPIILKADSDGGEVVRLEEGGTVLGLFADWNYKQGRIQLNPGDVFVGFTDGISEAMTKTDDEFGDERLIQSIRACASRPASEMISCIFADVDAFVAGARQHDDMTLSIVRLEQLAN